MHSGSLLLECSNEKDSERLMMCTSFGGRQVRVSPNHVSLSTSEGVISLQKRMDADENEIVREMKSQGVVEERKIKLQK